MSRKRRSFTTEYKVEAAHRVTDSGRTIAEVAREWVSTKPLLGRWVADERRRIEAAAASGDQPLTAAERTELARLRKQVSEQDGSPIRITPPHGTLSRRAGSSTRA
ncbi:MULTISPECIES: transposase [unclassified Rhodococcus (in: high G+C Gram-positive bacteria)]|uniref:transposase n=1 Tax=unclassified Rhodococcus (in: high G+C Gram-positive bacteria) TaxID=192944 RepID=UPI0039890E90